MQMATVGSRSCCQNIVVRNEADSMVLLAVAGSNVVLAEHMDQHSNPIRNCCSSSLVIEQRHT